MIKLFNDQKTDCLFQIIDENVIRDLNRINNIETVDDAELATKLARRYKIKLLSINTNGIKNTVAKENKRGEEFRPILDLDPNSTYQVVVGNYSIPYTGNVELFCAIPKIRSCKSYKALLIDENFLHFKIETIFGDFNEDAKKYINDQAKLFIDWIQSNLDELTKECTTYNDNLRDRIKLEIDNRIDEIKKRNQLSNDLNQFK